MDEYHYLTERERNAVIFMKGATGKGYCHMGEVGSQDAIAALYDALALLDAKDAEVERRRNEAECMREQSIANARERNAAERERDEARAQYAAAQAAMVEADRRAINPLGLLPTKWIVEPLQPHLPQPAPDPLVEALQHAYGAFGEGYDNHRAKLFREALAARGLHITEKKP